MGRLREHVGIPQTFTALGQTWTLSRWELAEWRQLAEWARRVLPDLKAEAAAFIKALPPGSDAAAAELVGRVAEDLRLPLGPGHPRLMAILDTMEGSVELMRVLLHASHPDLTDEDAFTLLIEIGQKEAVKLFSRCSGAARPKGDPAPPASPP